MLAIIVILVGIALLVFFSRAGKRNHIVYRKKVAPTDHGYSVNDHPYAFSPPLNADNTFSVESNRDAATDGPFAFEGGEFGGGGAGSDSNGFDPVDFNSGDPGSSDSSGSDSCADSSGSDSSNFSCD